MAGHPGDRLERLGSGKASVEPREYPAADLAEIGDLVGPPRRHRTAGSTQPASDPARIADVRSHHQRPVGRKPAGE